MKRIALALLASLVLFGPARPQSYDAIPVTIPGLSNTAQTVKASAGTVVWVECYNPNASVAYLQTFDVAGAVTVGTTAPKASYPVAATSSTGVVPASVNGPVFYSSAIKIAAATTPTGGTAPSTGLQCDVAYR